MTFTTTINAQPAEWPPEVQAKWAQSEPHIALKEGERVTTANYFTPRPYVDEYNRGSNTAGFCYATNFRRVFYTDWAQQAV